VLRFHGELGRLGFGHRRICPQLVENVELEIAAQRFLDHGAVRDAGPRCANLDPLQNVFVDRERRTYMVAPVTGHDLRTLRALTARLLPGPPEDPDPGALEAGAAEAIARLLEAFTEPEPPIHAAHGGGFVPLDTVAELGWRIRLEGSLGLPEREFAGPVMGLAQRLTDGLALLDQCTREACGAAFADAPMVDQDAVLEAADGELDEFISVALALTLEVVYGPSQYGGNPDGSSWQPLGWPGFTQPRGFTPQQVSEPDAGATASLEAVSELSSKLPDDAGWRLQPD
jgi:hypothetical protein